MARKTNKTAKNSQPDGDQVTIHDQKLTRGNGGELHQTAGGDTEA